MIEELLKNHNLKVTKQRIAVIKAINHLGLKANLSNIVLSCPNVNPSTVYRIIDIFLKSNVVEKNFNATNDVCYFLKNHHQHYFTCIRCGKQEKIEPCPVTSINNHLIKKGYQVLNHTILVSGICQKCAHL
jgi:Fe2+ or Zn2+ uptake regulation protein